MPHGGGEHYSEEEGKLHPDEADVTVSTLSELSEAVGPDRVVYVDSDIEFGSTELDVGASVDVENPENSPVYRGYDDPEA